MEAPPSLTYRSPFWAVNRDQPTKQPANHYHHYEPLPGPQWIRILNIDSAINFEAPLVCRIEAVPLAPHSRYTALSYSWAMNLDGDKRLSRVIELDGKPFPVTRNLLEGLRRIRNYEATQQPPRRVWIDGICINQADDVERGAQVAVMAQIYEYASATILWLGEGESEDEDLIVLRVLEQLETCHESDLASIFTAVFHTANCLLRPHRSGCICICSDPVLNRALGIATLEGDADVIEAFPKAILKIIQYIRPDLVEVIESRAHNLRAFLQRRYWSRRWIVQEVFYSISTHMYWGPCRMDLSRQTFDRSLDKISAIMKNLSWVVKGEVSNEVDQSCEYSKLHDAAEAIREHFRPSFPDSTSLLVHALGRFQSMECQDPRDKLYAFISLDQSFNIVPSYKLTTAEVYLQFAQAMIDRGMFMDIFHNFRQRFAMPREVQLDLPSWVPDLRLPFASIPRRVVKVPSELWAHRDGSLSCSLYHLGTVDAAGMESQDTFYVAINPASIKKAFQDRPKLPVEKYFHGLLDKLFAGGKSLAIEKGDLLFSPVPMEIPSNEWEAFKIIFLRRTGYFGDTMACMVVGEMVAHDFSLMDDYDEDVLESREMIVRLV